MKRIKKVLVFGTFDLLHPGHLFLIGQAKRFGDHITAVVARDETVRELKGRWPVQDEELRRRRIEPHVDVAVIGNSGDKIQVVIDSDPDFIVLGYDQISFLDKLKQRLGEAGLSPKIIRIEKSLCPEKFKSSKIRQVIYK